MPVVAIDCRFAHFPAGIGRFTREVVRELLLRRDPWTYGLILSPEAEAWAVSLPVQAPSVIVSSQHYSLSEHWTVPRACRTLHADFLFSPQFNVPFFLRTPFMVTIHDLILHHFPNQASLLKRSIYRILFSRAVRKARSVMTISHATEKGLLDLFGRRIGKNIHLVEPGVGEEFHPASLEDQHLLRERFDLHRPFFLYIGGAKEHKNVQMLVNAFSRLPSTTHDLLLLISGPEADGITLAPHVTLLRNVQDQDLPVFLSAAHAYVTATKEEGFGLPLLEAMACLCPVLASDIPAFRELFRNHARLLQLDPASFTEGMQNMIDEPVSERSLQEAREFAIRFTWKETAGKLAGEIARNV